MERLILQIATVFGALVLIGIGLTGAFLGVQFLHGTGNAVIDNYFRFLSAIVAGIGVLYLTTLPHIERRGRRFDVLTFLIVVGGLAHFYAFMMRPVPSNGTIFGLFMELIFAPLLWLLQRHVAKTAARRSH
ncbi:MAG: DUF4345 domain-containing protein [Afipia sp.]|nr:DUF4345 domain-containing protein [Afipia sp.]